MVEVAARPLEPARGRWHGVWRALRRDARFWISVAILTTFGAMAVWPSLFTSRSPTTCDLGRSLEHPSASHPFGFDLLGCDYLARTVHGARTSLTIGLSVVVVAALIALILGSVAGYVGGPVDAIISRATDVWFSVPVILGGMFFLTFIDQRGIWQVTAVIALLAWPAMVRLMRASVLETKNEEYVVAARALGASHLRILTRHVVPNSTRPLITYAALFTATAIATEAILSLMGVGLQLPAISWGLMLASIRPSLTNLPAAPGFNRLQGNAHLLIPGVFLVVAVFGFVLLSESLRDAFDPEARR